MSGVIRVVCMVFVIVEGGLCGQLVDLTHPITSHMPHYPLYSPFSLEVVQRGWSEMAGEQVWIEYNKFEMFEHMGTHIDAPCHLTTSPGKWRLHEIPITHFIGEAVVIDISHRADVITNPDAKPTVDDIVKWEHKYGKIGDGSVVFFYSGWDQYWGDSERYIGNDGNDTTQFHFPGISGEVAQWLVDHRNIHGVGVDTLSLDAGDQLWNHYAHIALLSQNIFGLENVNNLGKIPASGARVYVMPINIQDGSGGPCRVIAEYDFEHLSSSGDKLPVLATGLIIINCFLLIFRQL